jgi:hypothetical protein
VKPYHRDEQTENPAQDSVDPGEHPKDPSPLATNEPPRRRGRPRGSKNKPKVYVQYTARPVGLYANYVTRKEQEALELARKLRREGVITTPGAPFEASTKAEIEQLIKAGVFEFVRFGREVQSGQLFKARIVNEIKGQNAKPYEKSRLVVQGYNDSGKETVLTQSPTIQRCSQRLILALAPSLIRAGDHILTGRDITQAYPQSETDLQRAIYARLPESLEQSYPEGTVMRIIKPLYGIAESGVHWYATYHKHFTTRMKMMTSSYDPCLLIAGSDALGFGLIGMQTDDTLGLFDEALAAEEEHQLAEAKFKAKARIQLAEGTDLEFNGGRISLHGTTIKFVQKGQANALQIATRDPNAESYKSQRARGAWIASIAQPEASYDLSVAAQTQQNPSEEDINKLNKRLTWQMEHHDRGLNFIPLNLHNLKLYIFTDGSLANNRDMSSQIGFVIVLGTETKVEGQEPAFKLVGNILHWSSTKCKRVTRSSLASEVYGMVAGFDVGITIASTLRMITSKLSLPEIPLVICTDSLSLYECLVKLGTTAEKRLMIDVMALRQSYERREIAETRWIHGDDNPADALTKVKPNTALSKLVESNELRVRVQGDVKRPPKTGEAQ